MSGRVVSFILSFLRRQEAPYNSEAGHRTLRTNDAELTACKSPDTPRRHEGQQQQTHADDRIPDDMKPEASTLC
jgi:hypothetical protein